MALWGNKDSKTATGTVSIADTGVVTGSSTLFTTEAKVGNTIRAADIDYHIVSITSNTVAKVRMGKNNGGGLVAICSGQSYTLSEKPSFVPQESADSGIGIHGDSNKVFGVDATESSAGSDNVTGVALSFAGTGYTEATHTATVTGGGGSNAAITYTGSAAAPGTITSLSVTNVGSGYTSVPTVTFGLPRRTINTTFVTLDTASISYPSHLLTAGTEVKYFHGGGDAATGLVNNTADCITDLGLTANAFRLAASAAAAPGRANLTAPVVTSGTAGEFTCGASTLAVGDRVLISGTNAGTGTITGYTPGKIYEVSAVTGTSPSVTGFTLTEEGGDAVVTTAGTLTGVSFKPYTIVLISGTGNVAQYFELQAAANRATAVASLGAGASGTTLTHAGWVRRTVGTGGRAGRVQQEVLVAMGSMTGDQADDIQYPE